MPNAEDAKPRQLRSVWKLLFKILLSFSYFIILAEVLWAFLTYVFGKPLPNSVWLFYLANIITFTAPLVIMAAWFLYAVRRKYPVLWLLWFSALGVIGFVWSYESNTRRRYLEENSRFIVNLLYSNWWTVLNVGSMIVISLGVAFGLFYLRQHKRATYGHLEIVVGFATIISSAYQEQGTKLGLVLFSGIYILIRGLANVEEGLRPVRAADIGRERLTPWSYLVSLRAAVADLFFKSDVR